MYNNKCVFRNDLGRRAALVRHLRELTQKEVANKLGKTPSYVSAVESGRLPMVNANVWAKALGVSEKYIKEGGDISLEMV